MVATGFFLAARQHFATMEFGLRNSKLRKQVEDLEAERRRLILAKEVSLSPMELKQTAAKLGFREQIASPPVSTETREAKVLVQSAPVAELTSMKMQSLPTAPIQKKNDSKALVKPIVQATKALPASPNERPRIVSSERQIASAASKSFSKLR